MEVKWAQPLGRPECPFARRWLIDFGWFAIRLHRWYKLGAQEAMHDHAWWFVTVVLSGGYTDVSERDGELVRDRLRRGSVRFRPAHHKHYVHVDDGGGLTLLLSGRPVRDVFFWLDGVAWEPSKYLAKFGRQPCD